MSGYWNKKIIEKIGPIIQRSGIHNVCRKKYGGLGHILMFHRIVETESRARLHNHNSLEVTPEHLTSTIEYFKKRNYAFYSLDEMHQRLLADTLNKPFVVFTFDDGYIDNYTLAYPIFKKHNIPFAIYVTTCFPDKTVKLWWYLLEEKILSNSSITVEWNGKVKEYNATSLIDKERVFDQLRHFISQSPSESNRDRKIKSILGNYKLDNDKLLKSMCMDWEQILELSKDPLVTIGAHSVNHNTLSQLSEENLATELQLSKSRLESKLSMGINHFAYPFGKKIEASHREFEEASLVGYHTATTTRIGNIHQAHRQHLLCLPRININRVTTSRILDLQTSGCLSMIVNKGRKVITD